MTPERYQLASRLFLQLCDVPADQRESVLRNACGGDADLLEHVRCMLAQDQQPLPVSIDALLCELPTSPSPNAKAWHDQRHAAHARDEQFIGRYRLVRQIGVGGMGIVYLAEQDQPRRDVALKLIRPGFLSSQVLRRFQHEATILARLSHPGIAQVYEAGIADVALRQWRAETTGHRRDAASADNPAAPVDAAWAARDAETVRIPFFAMELVRGQPIDQFVHSRGLRTSERLELIAHVCDAVHHAHTKGVIHRDLKPANILVTADDTTSDVDGGPSGLHRPSAASSVQPFPKILDFGVARATGADMHAATVQTAVGQLVGTLSYMSPEQIAGRPDELDARSDVYALGVIMFELLTGRLPYDLADRSIAEVGRIIREQEPSWVARANVQTSKSPNVQSQHTRSTTCGRFDVADTPRMGARTFGRFGSACRIRLDRDVQTIIGKALEKDRSRRYGSAAELATDIRRYLRHEPIAARPPGAFYQFRKFAQRHTGLVAGTATAFAILVAALVVVSIQRIRIEHEANLARESSAFLESLLQAADPYPLHHGTTVPRSFGVEARFIDVLDDAVQRLDAHPLTSAEAEATIRYRMGMSYYGLGRYEQGARMLERALTIRQHLFGHADPRTLECQVGLVWNRTMMLDSLATEQLARQTVDAYVQRVGWAHEGTVKAMGALAMSQMYAGFINDAAETARTMCRLIEENSREVQFTPLLPRLLIADLNVREFGRVEEGRAMAQQVLREAESGSESTTNVPGYCRMILGRAARATGDLVEAERLMREGIAIWASVAQTQALSEMRGELATLITQQPGREQEGLDMWREVISAHREAHGSDSPLTCVLTARYAAALHGARRLDDAEQHYRWSIEQWIQSGRYPSVPRQVPIMYQFGCLLRERGKLDEAASVLNAAITLADHFDDAVWARSSFDRSRIVVELRETSTGRKVDKTK